MSIWKAKENEEGDSHLEQEAKLVRNLERDCRFYERGRCFAPFAESEATRCKGSLGCQDFKGRR